MYVQLNGSLLDLNQVMRFMLKDIIVLRAKTPWDLITSRLQWAKFTRERGSNRTHFHFSFHGTVRVVPIWSFHFESRYSSAQQGVPETVAGNELCEWRLLWLLHVWMHNWKEMLTHREFVCKFPVQYGTLCIPAVSLHISPLQGQGWKKLCTNTGLRRCFPRWWSASCFDLGN